jgi:hypothetical protein
MDTSVLVHNCALNGVCFCAITALLFCSHLLWTSHVSDFVSDVFTPTLVACSVAMQSTEFVMSINSLYTISHSMTLHV